jgi:hypothetical protein
MTEGGQKDKLNDKKIFALSEAERRDGGRREPEGGQKDK